ncbi:MAG: hypothetical protein ABI769_01890 [Pseudomonadota bacterium]
MKVFFKRSCGAICAALFMFAASMPAAYANIYCEGKIAYLSLNPDGSVNVSVGFGIWGICNVATTSVGNGAITFPPESCRAMFASMLASQKAGTSIGFYFTATASTSNGAECAAIGNWVWPNPAPYHMRILN